MLLKPEDWFGLGQDVAVGEKNEHGRWCAVERHGKWIWAPPPGAADVALEQLRLACLKRVKSKHVFVCPRLLSPRRRIHLHKVSDCVIECAVRQSFQENNLHEPLVFGICFFFISHKPLQLRQAPAILGVARELQRMSVSRLVLQQLCISTLNLDSLSAGVVWSMLQGPAVSLLSHRSPRK